MIKLLLTLAAIGYAAAQTTTCYQDDLKISMDAGGVGLFDWVDIDNTQHQENPYNLEPYDVYVSMTKGSLGTKCGTVRRAGSSQIHKIACRGTKGRWIHYKALPTTEMIVLCKVGVRGRPVPKPTPPPTTPKPTAPAKLNPHCTEVSQADIVFVFVIDASGSVTAANFPKEKAFVGEIIQQLNQIRQDGNGIRIAAMTYSHGRNFIWGPRLSSRMTRAQYKAGVLALRYTRGGTDTAKALRYAESELKGSGRGGIPKICIVITDGKSMSASATTAQANRMKGLGYHMISVGVGKNLNHAELSAMADKPLTQFKFVVNDFNLLATIAAKVKKAMFCKPQPHTG